MSPFHGWASIAVLIGPSRPLPALPPSELSAMVAATAEKTQVLQAFVPPAQAPAAARANHSARVCLRPRCSGPSLVLSEVGARTPCRTVARKEKGSSTRGPHPRSITTHDMHSRGKGPESSPTQTADVQDQAGNASSGFLISAQCFRKPT